MKQKLPKKGIMFKKNNIYKWLPIILIGVWLPLGLVAQKLEAPNPLDLPFGSHIKGVYKIQADNDNRYLKEQGNGYLELAPLSNTDGSFYFWVIENVFDNYFQLYSTKNKGKLVAINANGTAQLINNTKAENSKLLLRMYTTGPARTKTDENAGIVAIGHITTSTVPSPGNADCQCNFLKVDNRAGFRVHFSGMHADYRPIAFQKANNLNSAGSITYVEKGVQIAQSGSAFQNFVSSNFYVGGFGTDDFQLTINPGTEGYIGFVDYTRHGFKSEVYKDALPKIGLKVKDNKIALIYLSGGQPLPASNQTLGREAATTFETGKPILFGFQDQETFVASQGDKKASLKPGEPTEFFLNQSITLSARMVVRLKTGSMQLSYTPKNALVNFENDFGTTDGSELFSSEPFFPYNGGNSLINTFDWQQTKWKIKYHDTGDIKEEIFSPFYSREVGKEFAGIAARFKPDGTYAGSEDFSPVEGWELIKANLGYHANGEELNETPNYPYVLLYDRVAGILRAMVYTKNEGEANLLTISLESKPYNNSFRPKLWGNLQQFASLDKIENSRYSKLVPFKGSSGRNWYFADFIMEYDPCIAFFESSISLNLEKTTSGNLTMIGRMEGGSIPGGTKKYDNWKNNRENFLLGVMDNDFATLQNTMGDITFNQYDDFDLIDYSNEINGVLVGKNIPDWKKEAARLEWKGTKQEGEATIVEGSFKIVEGTAQIAEGLGKVGGKIGEFFGGDQVQAAAKIAQGTAKIAQGASTIVRGDAKLMVAHAKKMYYDDIKNKTKESDQDIHLTTPPPRPHVVFADIALKGTLTIQTPLFNDELIATPGGKNSNLAPEWHANGTRGSAPLYNRPLGNFTLLNQPKFAISVVKNATNGKFGACLKIQEKPYFAHNDLVLGKINDVFNISIHVQTLAMEQVRNSFDLRPIQSSTDYNAYTNLFGQSGSNALPGTQDISYLVDWQQIQKNIDLLPNKSDQEIQKQISSWIKVSYQVWSITMTNLQARNLSRAFAQSNRYFNGASTFAFQSSNNFGYDLYSEAKNIANQRFGEYNFSKHPSFGDRYNVYHSEYDKNSDALYTAMNNYCTQMSVAKGNMRMSDLNDVDIVIVDKEGLTTYPNPTTGKVTFNIVSPTEGKVGITLYDMSGRVLICTKDKVDHTKRLKGTVNISSLKQGIYLLKVELENGASYTNKIIKE